jgi:PBSX family phage terminase large subunit
MSGIQEFSPHEYQMKVLESKARFILALSGVQGGKTTIGAVWLLREIYDSFQQGQRGDWLIAAPTVKILEQSTLPKFEQFFPPDWGEWKEQKKYFQLVWGDRIFVRSTEEPDYLEGMTVRGAWLDEAGKMKHAAWINIQARLAIFQGRAVFTTTPYAVNWVNFDILKKAGSTNDIVNPSGEGYIAAYAWKSIDNPAFSRDEYERAKRNMPPAIFERRYDGKFTALEGLVYPDYSEDCLVDPFLIPENWKRFGGLDFGYTNPTALTCLAEDPDTKTFYVFDEFYRTESSLQLIADFIRDRKLEYVLADPQSAMVISELQRYHGLSNLAPANNDIAVGIERLGTLIREGRLKFLRDKCPSTIEEIEQYHYPPNDGDGPVSDKPVAKKNHAMDALRYCFSKRVESSIYNRAVQRKPYTYSRKLPPTDYWTGY